MEPNGGGEEYLFRARSPNWNPDSQSLIAWNGVSPTSIWKRFEIYFLNSSKPIRKLDAVVGDNRYPHYSPDGLKIVFASQPEGGGYHQVWIMASNDTSTRQLTKNGGWAADWSPDGEWIVYTETFDTGRLWLMRPDGSKKQQLTFE